MRTLLWGSALLGLVACGRRQPATEDVPVHLPIRSAPVARAATDSITITLAADGRIFARGQARTLAGLDDLLRETLQRDGPIATTTVRLRIDSAAPWLHVRWLVAVLAGHGVPEVQFVYSDPKGGETEIPCSVSPATMHGEPAPADTSILDVRIRITADGQLRCSPRTASGPEALDGWCATWVKRKVMERLAHIQAEIAVEDTMPWGTIAAVNERLRAGGVRYVIFAMGYVDASENVRKALRLPAPVGGRNAAAAAWGEDWQDGHETTMLGWSSVTEFTMQWPEVPEEDDR